MEQKLKLYKYDNGELVSFPSKESQIEIGVFTYTAKRMGDAPTITATINYKECLDNLWTGKECVIFNDEFFYVKNIPTSSYSNTDSRYKHECTFVNERSKLNGVLFTDVVDDKASDGKPVSNSSKFSFNGNITEFVARLNASLRYAKLQTIENSLVYGYHVVIDEGTKAIENFNDTFNVSFEDKTISEAIQEIYNSYNIPYYFEGKTVHVGLIDEEHDLLSDIDGGFKYGVNNELISISKSNKNNKIINRITALGSSENIPYYYPNETEKGSVAVTEYGKDTIPSYVELFNPFLFAKRIGKDDKIHYLKGNASWSTGVTIYEGDDSLDFKSVSFDESVKVKCQRDDGSYGEESNIKICFSIHIKNEKDYFCIKPSIAIDNGQFGSDYEYSFNKDLVVDAYLSNERGRIELEASDEGFNTVEIPVGAYQLWITYKVSHRYQKKSISFIIDKNVKVKLEVFNIYEKFWFLNDSTTRYNLEDFGLRLTGGVSPYNGMAFAQKVTIPYYPISQNLILPIYRSTQGEERFYNAYNATYKDENDNYYDFKNEYAEDSISEHIVKFDDIKPTIKGVEYNGRRIDKFVEFAYDKSDNDLKQVVEDNEEYQHPYFFAKLPPLGFNLFDHALETGEMTISMTSGHCAGCSFTIMVNDANKNTVQVDEDGNLKYDEGGYVLVGSVNGQGNQSPIDSQNDTTNNSVWIALKKDIDSFGTILPSSNIKPSSNDTFVITNILLPQEYIEAAEERLKNEAIKYMAENNSSKFSFSIKFSRIFLAENPTIFDKISENSRIAVNYNGSIYPLHVSSYSYKMSEGALLPEIDVSLTDSVVIATNAIESAVSEAKADVLTYVDRYATLEEATTIFIRKDKEDYSPSPMVYGRSLTVNESHKVGENLDVAKNATIGEKTTTKAIQVGEQASVGNYVEGVSGIVMKIDSDGSSYMELDRLKVRMKAYFDELEVQKVNTVGGKMIMSPAGSFTCGAVLTSEELLANGEVVDTTNGSFYRCFFNAVQDDEQIENKFIVGDFAFSQSFNLTGRSSNKMYWREVVGVSSTYVDLSYDKCALDSDIPSSGDIICQLGSKVKDRQNAIVMTTVDEYAPAITLHYGIDKFSLSGTEIIQYGVRDGKAFFNSYGDMFLGEKPVEGVSKAYMKYTTESGLEIKGKLTVGSTYNDKELGELFDAQQESLEKFKTSVTKEFENIRNEMDGAIDTWFGEETPTLENKPASDWLTNTDKDSHLGDLYYSNDGKAYRFQYTETEGYCWVTIEDSEVVKALELAQKALDTADGKRTIFIEQPKPPYQVGDLWAAGENQPLKRCIKSREDILESFYESDWDLADNSQAYADAIKDELQKSIKSTEDSLNKAIEDAEKAAKDYTDEGKTALKKSIDELNDAKANLDDVYTKATKDDTITKLEARALEAAQAEAKAAQALAEKVSAIYADGVVTKEEEARIEQAKANLAEAKAYAEAKANEAFNNANAEVEKFDYLKAALKESTDEEGGLIQTSLIKLGYTNAEGKHQVMSGTNGIADSSLIGGGIATWWGGEMHDLLDYYTWDNEWVAKENVTIPSNIPSGLIRFDGTGYFAKGNIWWDKTGNLHADPLSFFVGEDSVGALLASFQVVNDKDGKIDYLIPKAPFSSLTVGELRIKDENGRFVTLKFKDGVLLSDESFASDKTVSSLGVGSSEGGGVSYNRLDSWDSYTADKAGYVLSAALGWDLKTRLDNLDLGDFDLSGYLTKSEAQNTYATISALNGKQNAITANNKLSASLVSGLSTVATSGKYGDLSGLPTFGSLAFKNNLVASDIPSLSWSKITSDKPTTLAGYGITDGISTSNIGSQSVNYATSAGSADTATQLKEPVTLWGQSFDGTGNVSGNILLDNNIIYGSGYKNALDLTNGGFNIGYGYRNDTAIHYWGKSHYFVTGEKYGCIINSSGNVTIGGSDLAGTSAKLYVDGSVYVGNKKVLDRVSNNLHIGEGIRGSFDTSIFGTNILFNTTSGNNAMMIAIGGNVLIGTTTDSEYKLDVNGNGRYYHNTRYALEISSSTSSAIITFGGSNGYEKGQVGIGSDKTYMFNYESYRNNPNGVSGLAILNSGYFIVTKQGTVQLSESFFNINPSGNVTIGSGDLAGTSNKLYVEGAIYTTSGMSSQYIELNSKGELQGYGGFIDFHFNGSTDDYTCRIIEDGRNNLFINSSYLRLAGATTIGSPQDLAGSTYKLYVNGDSYVNGSLTVSSSAKVNSLNVNDKASITNAGAINGTSLVMAGGHIQLYKNDDSAADYFNIDNTGNTYIGGTLDVDGAATFGSTLKVAGATTLGDKLTISKNGMSVTGAAYFGGGTSYYFGSTGNVSANTLTAAGATSLKSTLAVTGATTLSSTLGVTGVATFNSNIKAKGYIYFGANDDAYIYWDAGKQVLRTNVSFASDKTISSLGVGTDEGGGGGSVDWGAVPMDIIPISDDYYNIGSPSLRFSEGHFNNVYADAVEVGSCTIYSNGNASFGSLSIGGADAATQTWVNTRLASYISKEGGTVSGTLTAGTAIYTGEKTAAWDGKSGAAIMASGNLVLVGTNPHIYFGYGNATTSTSSLEAIDDGGFRIVYNMEVFTSTVNKKNHIQLNYNNTRIYRLNNDASGMQFQYGTSASSVATKGTFSTSGAYSSSSDITKKNILSYNAGFNVRNIAEAPIAYFTWKDLTDNRVNLGSIAQYWQLIAPECIYGTEGIDMTMDCSTLGLVSSIINARAIVSHENEIDKLKRRVEELENENKRLQERVDALVA